MAPSTAAQRRLATYVPPVLVGLLALPFALTQNAFWEWTNALWLLERQAEHVKAHGLPTFFLHTELGRFYPFSVFYAGPTVALLAYPAAVLGAWPVFLAAIVAAMVAGYVGVWWTARSLGLCHWLAILPAATFALTPGLLSVLYGRGAWAELIAVNAAALMLGATTALLWGDQRRRGRAGVVLGICAALVAGTHNVTMLMAALVLPVAVAALLPVGAAGLGAGVLVRRLGRALVAIALGVGVTGAWLIPNLWLAGSTSIADPALGRASLTLSEPWVHASSLLLPWPSVPPVGRVPGASQLTLQPPVVIMAWTLAALVAVVALGRTRRFGASAVALLVLGTALLLVIVHPSWWLRLPERLWTIQFTFRLLPYLALLIALGVIVALRGLPSRLRPAWIRVLVAAVVVQAVMAAVAAVGTDAAPDRSAAGARPGDVVAERQPVAFVGKNHTPEAQFRVLGRPSGRRSEVETGERLGDPATSDRDVLFGKAAAGDAVLSPVVWSPLVRVDGDASIAGRDGNGLVVLTVDRVDAQGRWSAVARPRCSTPCLAFGGGIPWPLTAGGWLTVVSLLIALALAVVAPRGRRANRIPLVGAGAGVLRAEVAEPAGVRGARAG